jgi:type 2 lantibiotic biosynthesis protein LanM
LSFAEVLARFATVNRALSAPRPQWINDAVWIEAALQNPLAGGPAMVPAMEPVAFEHLLAPVVEQADLKLRSEIGETASANMSACAHAGLRHALLKDLSDVAAGALYERFSEAREGAAAPADADKRSRAGPTSHYDRFVAHMKAGGFRLMFEDKPVLLRLIATITRQWIETMLEFAERLDSDLRAIRCDILHNAVNSQVAQIEGNISDPHNGGRTVLIVHFEDGSRVVYKPKDLRLDVAWHALVERLNQSGTPFELKAARAIARDGYGWTEFIDHSGCADDGGCKRFFQRAGAWLALFHCFAGSDMHQENLIAAGEHPVPIDLEMILQATAAEHKSEGPEAQAFEAAMEIIDNSVMMVGLLPTYGRSFDNTLLEMGGLSSDWNSSTNLSWDNINSDSMRPAKWKEVGAFTPNLPHVDGRYSKFGDYAEDFVSGFENYATFLLSQGRGTDQGGLFDGFAGLPVRKIVHPTRIYYALLYRLKSYRTMDDGVAWSAQADFLARLADWERSFDPLWALQSAERAALITLNVPHFTFLSDAAEICGANNLSVSAAVTSGLSRARARVRYFDETEIAWQAEIIRQNTTVFLRSHHSISANAKGCRVLRPAAAVTPSVEAFLGEADRIAADLTRYAIRRGHGAAWIGLDWMGDSEVAQLVALGADLYNGVSGIALFLAAHFAVAGSKQSKELALAAVAYVRKKLNSRNAARVARSLGIGGATGLGSIVYAFAVMGKCLRDDSLIADAHVAAALFSDDLIEADRRLDVIGGSAGGILGLLRLHRDW